MALPVPYFEIFRFFQTIVVQIMENTQYLKKLIIKNRSNNVPNSLSS